MGLFWQKKEKKAEREWNLDFLTAEEKSSVNMAFEMGERLMAGRPASEKDALAQAKKHYLADMGHIDSGECYTKEDLSIIAVYVSLTQKMLAETRLPGTEKPLQLLTQVEKKFSDSGMVSELAGVEIPTEKGLRKDLSFLLPAEKNVVRIALDLVCNTGYYEGKELSACQNAKAHLLSDSGYVPEDFQFMGWSLEVLIGVLNGKLKNPGNERQKYQTNLNLATSALKKLRY